MPGQVTAIIPPEFRTEAVINVLLSEIEKFSPFLVKDFEQTTRYWRGDKPKFTPVTIHQPGRIVLQIRVVGPTKGREKWGWVNEGTKPHKILPKKAKYLRFRTGFTAGSTPGSLFTMASSTTGPFRTSKGVNHPGTKARGWSDLIVKDNQKPFERWMEAAMKRAARESGHGA